MGIRGSVWHTYAIAVSYLSNEKGSKSWKIKLFASSWIIFRQEGQQLFVKANSELCKTPMKSFNEPRINRVLKRQHYWFSRISIDWKLLLCTSRKFMCCLSFYFSLWQCLFLRPTLSIIWHVTVIVFRFTLNSDWIFLSKHADTEEWPSTVKGPWDWS